MKIEIQEAINWIEGNIEDEITLKRIIDIAFKYGFNSQESFTKSFFKAFDINPGEYVKTKKAIPLVFKKDVLFPDHLLKKGEIIMVKDQEIKITLDETEKHKFVYLERIGVDNYIDFWQEEEKNGKTVIYSMVSSQASLEFFLKGMVHSQKTDIFLEKMLHLII